MNETSKTIELEKALREVIAVADELFAHLATSDNRDLCSPADLAVIRRAKALLNSRDAAWSTKTDAPRDNTTKTSDSEESDVIQEVVNIFSKGFTFAETLATSAMEFIEKIEKKIDEATTETDAKKQS